jgi:hypothetical protein
MKIQYRYLITASLLVLILLISMLSCSSGNSNSNGITAENVGGKVQTALQSLRSYEMEMEIALNAEGEAEGQALTMKMSGKANGAVDLDAKKSGVEMALIVTGKSGTEKIDQTTKTSTYIIEDTTYVGTSDENGKVTWQTQPTTSNAWEQQQQTEQLLTLLDSSNIKYLKSEKVQGTQCYLIELEPDPEALLNTVMNQMNGSSSGTDSGLPSDAVKKVTVKYWFAQDSLFLRKAYVLMEMQLNAEDLGAKEGNLTYVIELTMDFNKFNSGVNIILPAEATKS